MVVQPVSNDLGNDFILGVAKTIGSEVPKVYSIIAFGD